MPQEIKGFFGRYRWLSNFWEVPVTYCGRIYPTAENAYQAAKVEDLTEELAKKFTSMTPGGAKRLGKRVKLKANWDKIKFAVMREILVSKFCGDDTLRRQLIATGDAYLEETNSWGDKCWGVYRGVGDNNLGKLLMEIRAEFIRNGHTQ